LSGHREKRNRLRWLMAGLAGVFVLSAIVWSARLLFVGAGGAAGEGPDGGRASIEEQVGDASYPVGSDGPGGADVIVAQLQQATQRILEERGSARRAQGLSQAVADTLRAYTSDSIDEWERYLRDYGIEPPAMDTEVERERVATMWRYTGRFFSDARFDPEVVRLGGAGGPDIEGASKSSRRDAGRLFLRDLRRDEAETVEVVLPGAFTGVRGGVFEGMLGLEFTLDPREDQWVLTGVQLYGVPSGIVVPGFLL